MRNWSSSPHFLVEAAWDHDLSVEGMEGGQAWVVQTLMNELWVFQLGALMEEWRQLFPDLSAWPESPSWCFGINVPRKSLIIPGHVSRSRFASNLPLLPQHNLGSTCSVDSLNLIPGEFPRGVVLTWSSWRLDYRAVGVDYWPCMALSFSCILEVVGWKVPTLGLISMWEGSELCCSLSLWSYLRLVKTGRALCCMGLVSNFICRITRSGSRILAKTATAGAALSPVSPQSVKPLSVTSRR